MYRVSESSVKAHFRVTLSVPTLAVATVPLLVFMYRDLATYGSRVTIRENESTSNQIITGNNTIYLEYN